MKLNIFILIFFSIILLNTCDILRLSVFDVVSWTPGSGYHGEPEDIKVSLVFSRNPDRASVERNFSLTGNGTGIRGNFIWEGKKLTFSPLVHLEINTNYIINISANASDITGLSFDEAFIREFTTRSDNVRPVLVSCFPSMYAETDDSGIEVKLEFSVPITLKTLYDNVSFSPSMTGFWRLENDDKLGIFIPSEPWKQNTRYEIRYSSSLAAKNGMNTGNDFLSIFTTGTDREIPYLTSAQRITKDGNVFLLIPGNGFSGTAQLPEENSDWEKDDRLLLAFSKPVDSNTVKNYLTIDNGPGFLMETIPGFSTEFIFRPENHAVYESRFTFRIKPGVKDNAGNESNDEYIYRIFANGKKSKPPEFAGIRLPMAPGNDTDINLKFYHIDSLYEIIPITDENYPSGEIIETWIELYFKTAQEALIDPFSVMELFRIETSNNVINFSPNHVKQNNFSVPDPHTGWEDYQRIEIAGNLINSTFFGIINFQISAGLKDNLGNLSDKLFRISLIK